MTMYAGDEFYDDDVTSGPVDDDWSEIDDDNLSGEFSDVAQGRYDFE
ncbi:MAG: hypothetical protein KA274_16580 [Ilumatobacteraceae bacterium]|nr:hypothetical protein [Ilumatobacteraceae bacterium]